MSSSIYASLQGVGRQFRLLVLEPAPDRLDLLRCQLNQVSFDAGDLEYIALSYTWGVELATTPILINGVETWVTLNLEAALRHIRKSSCAVILWVDALCIDQKNNREKSHQVQMMREIYSGAKLVIAWLGSASEDSDLVMEILGTSFEAWMEAGGEGNQNITDQPSISPASRQSIRTDALYWATKRVTQREALAISNFLKRSWWSRIWVVQEVLLAKRVIFKCGDAEVPGEHMRRWEQRAIILSCFSTPWVDRNFIIRCMTALQLLTDMGGLHDVDRAINYLLRYTTRHATIPHDHIYGLFSLFPKDDQVLLEAPDYEYGVEDLFIGVATKLMLGHNSLMLLLVAALTRQKAASSANIRLPSWVPDWTRPHTHYETDWCQINPFTEPEFYFSEDSKKLILQCFEIDEIESLKPVPPLAQGKMPTWPSASETECTRESQGPPPFQEVIIALFNYFNEDIAVRFDDDRKGFEFVAAFLQELGEYRISLNRDEAGDGHSETDHLAGFLEWTDDRRNGRTDEEILQKVFSVQTAHSFVKWYHRQSKGDLQSFYVSYSLRRMLVPNLSINRTCKGSISIAETVQAAPGDVLCVVPSCPAPLLFRKVQESNYMLTGSCSRAAGAMYGNLRQASEKREIVKGLFILV